LGIGGGNQPIKLIVTNRQLAIFRFATMSSGFGRSLPIETACQQKYLITCPMHT